MSGVLLDTHAWSWLLSNNARLSAVARSVTASADDVWISPVSFYEIVQKCRLGKWPEMAIFAHELPKLLETQGGKVANVTASIIMEAAYLPWPHRDPFDRIIAATAIELNVPLLSADEAFEWLASIGGWPGRLW